MPVKKKERTDKLCELTKKEKGKFDTLKQEIENPGKKKSLILWKSKQNENIIAKKFTKIGDEAQKILTTKIPYSKEGREGISVESAITQGD